MDKVINIDGGIGRVLCAEPAISALAQTELVTVVTSWPEVFDNHPFIERIYHSNHRYLFEDVVKTRDFISPEPYQNHFYYTHKHHLIQSFDYLINGTDRMTRPAVYIQPNERESCITKLQPIMDGRPVVALQAFGSSAIGGAWGITDHTHRSLPSYVVEALADSSPDVLFLNCSQFKGDRPNIINQECSVRELIVVVSMCDYVISIDSLTAHLGYAYGKKGIQLLGGTYKENVGYPDTYTVVMKDGYPKSHEANRIGGSLNKNSGAMCYSQEEIHNIIMTMRNDLGLVTDIE